MNKKILIIVLLVNFLFKNLSAQNTFPKQLIGYWVNAEYEKIISDSQYIEMGDLISPQFMFFDSLGNCTLQTRIEHKLFVGKPIRKRKFGDAFQFTYNINKNSFNINEVEKNTNLLYVSFNDVPVGILFKKYKRN